MQNNDTQTTASVAAIILAAGRSTRMHNSNDHVHKLLLPLGSGTVLSSVVSATIASQAHPVLVVLGYQGEQIRASLAQTLYISPDGVPPDLLFVENTAFASGMSTSLHAGFRALLQQADNQPEYVCDGALVLLGDQPLITTSLLNQLIQSRQQSGKRIIAPFYNGKRGNPVLFAADLFTKLLTITGDEGARTIIEQHQDEIEKLALDDAQAWYDVDTWEAYQQVLQIWQQRSSKP